MFIRFLVLPCWAAVAQGAPDPFGAPHAPHALASAAPQQCHTAAQRERAADAEAGNATGGILGELGKNRGRMPVYPRN